MPDAAQDRRFMDAALVLGRRGFGTTAPNPCVAALVVSDGCIVGRGVTAPGGRPHAEPLALAEAGERARGATLYVTLEPCSHVGRGRPCIEAILASGIGRVVVACSDPDGRVAGRGITQLRDAGVAVTTGVGEARARRDHLGHLLRVGSGRPSVTLKLAETADGIAGAAPGAPRLMITSETANGWTQVARAMHDAVMIGAGTARDDDPLLTLRLPGLTARQPLRVVLDTHGTLDPASRLARSAATAPVLLIVGSSADRTIQAALRACGVDIADVSLASDGRLDPVAALSLLATRGVTRVFCEGGPTLAATLLAAGVVDDLVLLTAPHRHGGAGRFALDPAARALLDSGPLRLAEDRPLGPDRRRRYERLLPCSPD